MKKRFDSVSIFGLVLIILIYCMPARPVAMPLSEAGNATTIIFDIDHDGIADKTLRRSASPSVSAPTPHEQEYFQRHKQRYQ